MLALATDGGNPAAVLLAFVVANALCTGAWTSAYPTFTELFPTHLRAAGVGFSVGVGRFGAAFGVLLVTYIANHLGIGAGYWLVACFWLIGAVALVIWTVTGGAEAARRPLESLLPKAAPALEREGRVELTTDTSDQNADWDAGETGCGELVIQLKIRMRKLPAGELFHLVARDPGAREDIPAWCRLTGNELLVADHPRYLIRHQGSK